MGLIRYGGVLLKRGDALANGLACCCDDCDCCSFNSITVIDNTFTYTGSFGVTVGAVVSGSVKKVGNTGCASQADNAAQHCVGALEFQVAITNGACQQQETVDAKACLFVLRSKDNYDKGNCCYWEVELDEPTIACLQDGFPANQPAILPFCKGSDAPSDCTFIIPSDACYGKCSTGGFATISFTTNSTGRCLCVGDEEYI